MPFTWTFVKRSIRYRTKTVKEIRKIWNKREITPSCRIENKNYSSNDLAQNGQI